MDVPRPCLHRLTSYQSATQSPPIAPTEEGKREVGEKERRKGRKEEAEREVKNRNKIGGRGHEESAKNRVKKRLLYRIEDEETDQTKREEDNQEIEIMRERLKINIIGK